MVDTALQEFVSDLLECMVHQYSKNEDLDIKLTNEWATLQQCAREHRLGFRPAQYGRAIRNFLEGPFQDSWVDNLLERAYPLEVAISDLIDDIEES